MTQTKKSFGHAIPGTYLAIPYTGSISICGTVDEDGNIISYTADDGSPALDRDFRAKWSSTRGYKVLGEDE